MIRPPHPKWKECGARNKETLPIHPLLVSADPSLQPLEALILNSNLRLIPILPVRKALSISLHNILFDGQDPILEPEGERRRLGLCLRLAR